MARNVDQACDSGLWAGAIMSVPTATRAAPLQGPRSDAPSSCCAAAFTAALCVPLLQPKTRWRCDAPGPRAVSLHPAA